MNSENKKSVLTENKMGVMRVGKLLFSMAVPMMISMLVQAFYNVVDSVFVAQISENALNAVSLAFPLQSLMIAFGGQEITMFNYCGFGDFSLTSLNDMSRNRTLGLLIGKGFFNSGISEKVVLEGRIAVDVFYQKVQDSSIDINAFPLMSELYHVFNDNDYPTKKFVKNVLNKIK